jgi:2-octaprenyl-6-methoxyphenol hydroxylase
MQDQDIFDIAVIGAGAAGLVTAATCAARGLRTALIGPPARHDLRSSALFGGSIDVLKTAGAWDEVAHAAEPVTGIRIIDESPRLLKAPEVLFAAREAGFEAFGYNIPNADLTRALEAACGARVARIDAVVEAADLSGDEAVLTVASGARVSARLVAAADGRSSKLRSLAGIETRSWSYPQAAIVTSFRHSRTHHNISTELHRGTGPLTVVPGRGSTSHLVWIDSPDTIERLAGLADGEFAVSLREALKGLLGSVSEVTPRQSFPIGGQTARALARNRVVLIGEAAHVLPPIGAQGLNLSFRDAATLAEVAARAKQSGQDPGGAETLQSYEASRRTDVKTRIFAIDVLNKSLLSTLPGVALARGFGLFALASSRTLRGSLMREGMMPVAARGSFQHEPAGNLQGET